MSQNQKINGENQLTFKTGTIGTIQNKICCACCTFPYRAITRNVRRQTM